MDIFLLRHGTAESIAPRDQDRRLSAEGREGLNLVLTDCQEELKRVEKVLVSPYVRALQTLNVALPFLPLVSQEQCDTVDFLTPGGSPQAIINWLCHNQPQSVLLVTHQPLVGILLDELCALEPGRYRMGTGALAAVKMDTVSAGLGELKWLKQAQV